MRDLLHDLNPAQEEAVKHIDGPLLILAGAGSGKTRVITRRIAWLIQEAQVYPEEILALTFTNKAAGEMKERVQELLGAVGRRVWTSTFHSAGLRILREHGEAIGISPNLVVYDDSASLSLIDRVIKDSGYDTSAITPRAIRSRIDFAKSCGQGPEDLHVPSGDITAEKSQEVYRLYQKALRASNAVDFGDLLVESVRLLREHSSVLNYYRSRIRFLMVDEFQDTSPVQYDLVRLLSKESGNLAVVGDDDQSIYGWRGADVRNILAFESDYADSKVVRLEQNYRSTKPILDAAYKVISRIYERKEKRLFTTQDGGELLRLLGARDETEEARLVAEEVERAILEGCPRSEIALFYRVNAMSRVLEDALRERRIPYQVIRGRSFYDRAEIKDILAYLRLAVNPDSDADTLRVINTPRRGIGAKTILGLRRHATLAGISLIRTIQSPLLAGSLSAAAIKRLQCFAQIVSDLHQMVLDEREPADVVREAIESTGYRDSLVVEDSHESLERLGNLEELVYLFSQEREESGGLLDLLNEMALLGDADFDGDPERVSLMTLHAAKGLEFEVVCMVGMEERVFPHSRAYSGHAWNEDTDAMSEERRLCYVGFTRAKRRLILGVAESRWLMGQRLSLTPSRFLTEVPGELVEVRYGSYQTQRLIQSQRRIERSGLLVPAQDDCVESVVDYSFDQRPSDECLGSVFPGGRVRHRSFGEGVIREVDGFGRNARLLIDFPEVGSKKILARYLELI